MDFRTFVRIIAFRWKIVVVAILACLAGAAIITGVQHKSYQSSATIIVSFSGASTVAEVAQATDASQRRLSSYAEIAGSTALAQRAVDQLHVPLTADQLVARTKVTYTPESLLFRITVTDSDPQRVAQLATAMADQFAHLVPQLEPAQMAPPAEGAPPAPTAYAKVLEWPSVPSIPYRPVPMRNLAQGLVGGVLLGLALALIRDTTDRTVRSREKLDQASGVPLLAELPRLPEASSSGSDSEQSAGMYNEAVRALRNGLRARTGDDCRSVLMTGPVVDDSVTSTLLNLSLSFAEVGEKVVLVEGDPRRPVIADFLHVQSEVGLADVMAERQTVDDALHPTSQNDLWVLASNENAKPDWHFGTAMLERTIEKLSARFDWVLVDGPPALTTADTGMLASSVQATVLVVRAGKTSTDEVTAAVENLRAAGAQVIGTVLTDARPSRHAKNAARAYQAKVGEGQ